MKKDITKFVSKKSKEEHLIKRFMKLVKEAKTKEDIRELEMRLLRPKPLPYFKAADKKVVGFDEFKQKSIRLTFKHKSIIKRWGNLFRINSYIEHNTYDVDFIVELFNLLESGRIIWDNKKNKYYLKTKAGRRLRL